MVETANLKIIPLNAAELECYLQGEGKLEKLFNLKLTGRTVSPGSKRKDQQDRSARTPDNGRIRLSLQYLLDRS